MLLNVLMGIAVASIGLTVIAVKIYLVVLVIKCLQKYLA